MATEKETKFLSTEDQVRDLNIEGNRLRVDIDNLGYENFRLRKDLKLLQERFKDVNALLSDKKLPDVYSENKRLKYEAALEKKQREWDLMKAGKSEEEESWMASYGDMVTLLLVFFVFLYSFSIADPVKFREASKSFVETFKGEGSVELEPSPPIAEKKEPETAIEDDFLEKMKAEMEDLIRDKSLEDEINLVWKSGELVIAIKARIFFQSGKADLMEEAKPVLGEITRLLTSAPKIVVEGHTDDIPIHNPEFPSNWELSTARACRVIRFFIDKGGISPEKLSAVGYAQFIPLVPNIQEDNRSANRRVEIKIRHRK